MSMSPEAGPQVVVSSSNHGKLAEIRSTLDFPGWRFTAAGELDAEWPSPDETGETFEANARIKAVAAEHGIPMVENVELARALIREVEIGKPIKPKWFKAVAEILAAVYQLRKAG